MRISAWFCAPATPSPGPSPIANQTHRATKPWGRGAPSSDKTCKLWAVDTGECLQTLEGHTDEIFSCAFNYEGVPPPSLWDSIPWCSAGTLSSGDCCRDWS